MNEQSVYVLRKVPPKGDQIEKFEFAEKDSPLGSRHIMLDFTRWCDKDGQLLVPRLATVWRPRKVIGYVQRGNDYPTVYGFIPAFSENAVNGLRDILEDNGELLPLMTSSELGPYWAYNLRTVAKVLDESRSDLQLEADSFVIDKIVHHEFHADQLGSLTIFRVQRSISHIYVTQTFVNRVRELKLNGFYFIKVWPLPPGTDWERLAREEHRRAAGKQRTIPVPPVAPPTRTFTTRLLSSNEDKEVAESLARFRSDPRTRDIAVSNKLTQQYIGQTLDAIRASHSRDMSYLLDEGFRLGVAWGQMLVQELGWRWQILVAENGEETLAATSPDKSLAMPVLVYFKRLVADPRSEVNTELTFNMIVAGKFSAPPGSLHLVG